MARIPGRRPRLPALFRLAVSTQDQFDLVVVGAGPAGEKGAAQAAYFGKRVCLIERAPKPGGAAVNMGIPAKALRESALFFSGLRQRGLFGMELRVQPGISLADFLPRERSAVDAASMFAMIRPTAARVGWRVCLARRASRVRAWPWGCACRGRSCAARCV